MGTWAGGNNSLNLRISLEKEIMAMCAVSGFSPQTPFVAIWARQCHVDEDGVESSL